MSPLLVKIFKLTLWITNAALFQSVLVYFAFTEPPFNFKINNSCLLGLLLSCFREEILTGTDDWGPNLERLSTFVVAKEGSSFSDE